MSIRHKQKRRARRTRFLQRCQHEGCTHAGLPCFYPENYSQKPDEFFCGEHCHLAGYCRGCGKFWGGICSFDFSPSGLCENCHYENNAEIEYDDWEFDDLDNPFSALNAALP